MKRNAPLALISSLISLLLFPLSSSAETAEPNDWWRNCGLWNLTDNCVESIEFFNHSSKTWVATVPEKNPDWVPNG
ncbi:MAG: hypothetical protein FJW51_04235 [Actinobacteria bacterium]|nr:hypothetical protein [Actinomycetota bacterium]